MKIRIKRVYDQPSKQDGARVLVDRLWPRGMSKADAQLDAWAKDLAPSTELRKWFDHDPDKFNRFVKRYRRELSANKAKIEELLNQIDRRRTLTLLYAARDTAINHVVVMRDFLNEHS